MNLKADCKTQEIWRRLEGLGFTIFAPAHVVHVALLLLLLVVMVAVVVEVTLLLLLLLPAAGGGGGARLVVHLDECSDQLPAPNPTSST